MRVVDLLWDKVTPAGSTETAIVDVARYHRLLVYASAAAATGQGAVQLVLDDGTVLGALTTNASIAAGASANLSLGPGVTGGNTLGVPVPRRVRFSATGGAGGTVRLIAYGIAEEVA